LELTNKNRTYLDEISKSFDHFRIGKINQHKKIVNEGSLLSSVLLSRFYLEVFKQGDRFSVLLQDFSSIDSWLSSIDEYLKYPKLSSDIDPTLLTLSPEAFGYLLHEGLGHRLESDDYLSPYEWKEFKEVNFDVYDCPGEDNWFGYCPFGDNGEKAKRVTLLCGKTGKTSLMGEESGNLRMVNYHFHPIIRQRCLVVQENIISKYPKELGVLHIKGIEKGIFYSDRVKLFTCQQLFKTRKNKMYRMPRLEIELGIEDIKEFSTYGKNELSEPPAGCKKGIQGQLPISFYTPPAWANLNDLSIKIEVL
jgi:hypothetical protein